MPCYGNRGLKLRKPLSRTDFPRCARGKRSQRRVGVRSRTASHAREFARKPEIRSGGAAGARKQSPAVRLGTENAPETWTGSISGGENGELQAGPPHGEQGTSPRPRSRSARITRGQPGRARRRKSRDPAASETGFRGLQLQNRNCGGSKTRTSAAPESEPWRLRIQDFSGSGTVTSAASEPRLQQVRNRQIGSSGLTRSAAGVPGSPGAGSPPRRARPLPPSVLSPLWTAGLPAGGRPSR